MRALIVWPLLGAAASMGCAFAAVGVAFYPNALAWSAGSLYGGFGLAAGAVCGVLDLAWRRLPSVPAARREAGRAAGREPQARALVVPPAPRRSDGPAHAARPSSFGA